MLYKCEWFKKRLYKQASTIKSQLRKMQCAVLKRQNIALFENMSCACVYDVVDEPKPLLICVAPTPLTMPSTTLSSRGRSTHSDRGLIVPASSVACESPVEAEH